MEGVTLRLKMDGVLATELSHVMAETETDIASLLKKFIKLGLLVHRNPGKVIWKDGDKERAIVL